MWRALILLLGLLVVAVVVWAGASSDIGGQKYWIQGVPLRGLPSGSRDRNGQQYWIQGAPGELVLPPTATVTPTNTPAVTNTPTSTPTPTATPTPINTCQSDSDCPAGGYQCQTPTPH